MPGKYKRNGTVYDLASGGKYKRNGTEYELTAGKYKRKGTVYDIKFGELPAGYYEVEHVSTTEYGPMVVLPIKTTPGLTMDFDCAFLEAFSSGNSQGCIIGDKIAGNGAKFGFMSFVYGSKHISPRFEVLSMDLSDDNISYTFGDFFHIKLETSSLSGATEAKMTTDYNGTASAKSGQVDGELPSYQMYLFSIPSTTTTSKGGAFKHIYAYDYDDSLLMHLIPCVRKEDEEIGFWDTVTEAFLTNTGTGTLSAGPVV